MARTKRSEASLRGYLNGVIALASVCSDRVGRSDVVTVLYARADFPDAFQKDYRLRTPLVLSESSETFKQTLVQWLGRTEWKLTDKVIALVERELGPAQRVLRAENAGALLDDLSASERGFGAFYITEDAFFVAFPEHVLVFLLGNFE